MAFSIRTREEKKTGIKQGLLEVSSMQKLQNRFCEANQVYLMCLSKGQGYLTKTYGSKEELEFLHSNMDMNKNVELFQKLSADDRYRMLEEMGGKEYMKVCGVPIRIDKEVEAIWIMVGVLDGYSVGMPDCVMRTTADHYYKSLDLLVTLTEQIFSVNREELMAQEIFLKGKESISKMEAALHRNEALSDIIEVTDSGEDVWKAADSILRETCEYLDIPKGELLKEEPPFFHGKTYIISSDSLMPDAFSRFFCQNGWTAAMFLPMDRCRCGKLYLCLMENKKKRIWSTEEIQFVYDVKRILQCIL